MVTQIKRESPDSPQPSQHNPTAAPAIGVESSVGRSRIEPSSVPLHRRIAAVTAAGNSAVVSLIQREEQGSQYIPYSTEARELRSPSNDIASLSGVSLEELIPLYLAGFRLRRVSETGEVYSRDWVLGDLGTAVVVGHIRARLATKTDRPALQQWFTNLAITTPGATSRKERLVGLIEEAFVRADEGQQGAVALVESGRQGRTMAPRGQGFGDRIHAAMDVPAQRGTGAYSPLDGVVALSGRKRGYGNLVIVVHERPPETPEGGTGPIATTFCHLNELAVTTGEGVRANQSVGTVGNSGAGEGGVRPNMAPHLHFAVLRVPRGTDAGGISQQYNSRFEERHAINPALWLGQLGTGIQPGRAPRWPQGRRGRNVEPVSRATVQRQVIEDDLHDGLIAQRMRQLEWAIPDRRLTETEVKYGEHRSLTARQLDAAVRRAIPANSGATMLTSAQIEALCRDSTNRDLSNRIATLVGQATGRGLWRQLQIIESAAPSLVRLLETAFIQDPNASALDLLGGAEGQEYRDRDWDPKDYPGGPRGPGEQAARRMTRALNAIRPERRANSGPDGVVRRAEFTRSMESFVNSRLVDIPQPEAADGFPTGVVQPSNKKLFDSAQQSFVRMRGVAAAEGVPLVVLAGWRSAARASANAARSGNSAAVANFSTHTLGLAVDLRMALRGESYGEIRTQPMNGVVSMRESSVHKWMFMRGADFGWFPYQNEPWHWEFNPPGFRSTFRTAAAAAGP